jgi:hypothetical protein
MYVFLAVVPFSSIIQTVGLTGREYGRQKDRPTDRKTDCQTDIQKERQNDRLCNIYQYCTVRQLFRQASKHEVRQAGWQVCQAGRQAGRREGGQKGWEEGRQEVRRAGIQADMNSGRQTNVKNDRCANIYTNIQKIKTYRHTQTN